MTHISCSYINRRIFNMKQICYILSFILSPSLVNSQSITEQTNEVVTGSQLNTWNLNNYLWSYSKCEVGKGNKRLLDFETIENWQGMGADVSVSNDGKYFAYTIVKGHYHNDQYAMYDSLVIQSTEDNTLRRVFSKANPGFFTTDSKQYIFQTSEGTLCFLQLSSNQYRQTDDVASYKVNSRIEWLACQLKNEESEVVLQNLLTGKENRFSGVTDYQFDKRGEWFSCQIDSKDKHSGTKELLLYQLASGTEKRFSDVAGYSIAASGKVLLLKTMRKMGGEMITSLQYISLQGKTEPTIIWSSKNEKVAIGSYNIDDEGKQVVFSMLDSSNAAEGVSIYYYKKGMDNAIVKASNKSNGIPNEFIIQGPVSFIENGNYIQLSLRQSSSSIKPDPKMVQLEVWSYKDMFMPSAGTGLYKKPIKAVISTENSNVIPLEFEKTVYKIKGDYAIVKKAGNEIHGDRFWEDGYYDDSTWLVSLKDGSLHLLPNKCNDGNNDFWFSPGGKYIVYFEAHGNGQYFSYNLDSKEEKSISVHISPAEEFGYISEYSYNSNPEFPIGIAAWLQNDEGVLVYAKHDIWLLDLTGKKAAINITNGYGLSHNIIFSLLNGERLTLNYDEIPLIKKKDTLILTSFSSINKYNGFYLKTLVKTDNPELLYSGPYFFNKIRGCHDLHLSNNGHVPIKAKDAKVWVVQRQSGSDAPNYYKTRDFKSFSRLTNFQPHAGFNWLSQELHTYQHLDGKFGQGILYKPENFDSSKKYPVIIIFYQTFSGTLNQFRVPSLNRSAITPGESPIWFLNNGYLVFTPDVYVTRFKYGPTAFNVIEGVARYLKQLPYVNANELAFASHSWSSQLGAYMFTHSTSFNAAAINEGMAYGDMLNYAFSPNDKGNTLETVEKERESGSLWENKEVWLDQTTILNVDKATSPLLLICNKESTADYQDQTFQFFNALRRLDKKVWWLKYEKGSHTLSDQDEMKDFTIRYMQYFDHYLKEGPAPRWMTEGIPLKLKGIESRYELDPRGNCGKACAICEAWNQQYKKTPGMFQLEIKDWVLDKDIAIELEQKIKERRMQLDKEGEMQRKEVLKKMSGRQKRPSQADTCVGPGIIQVLQ
jgi:dipeptidyl aminopeptidase/acylaminoacyl peptidase